MTSLYIDPDDLKATLSVSGTTFFDDDVERAALAASEGIDRELERSFGKSSEDETRYFTTYGGDVVYIDDVAEVTSIRVDSGDGDFDDWTETTDYILDPVNGPTVGKPYTAIRTSRSQRWFSCDRYARVEVVGKFGWPSVPTSVVEAAGLIAEQLIQRKRSMPMGFVISGDTAAYIIRNDPQIAFLLKGLGRRQLFV